MSDYVNDQERLLKEAKDKSTLVRNSSELQPHEFLLDELNIEWLIQQAEEKQELETMIESQNNVIDNLQQQNKRYEEALNEIYENKEDLSSYNDILIAERALQNK